MTPPSDHFPRKEYLESACKRIEEWLRRGDAASVELMEAHLLYRLVSTAKESAKQEGDLDAKRRYTHAQQQFRKVRTLDARGETASPGIANLALLGAVDPTLSVTVEEFENIPAKLQEKHDAGTLLAFLGLYGSQRGLRFTPGVQAKILSSKERGRSFKSFADTFYQIGEELTRLEATEAQQLLIAGDPLVDWQAIFPST